jgi:molybdopterin-guanine dinucleotide biosynthesis protein A
MGTDKALLQFNGTSLIERVLATLAPDFRDILIVGDRPEYYGLRARVVSDAWPGAGALGGIATALRRAENPYVMCLACDMPLVSHRLLRAMATEPRDFDVLALVTTLMRGSSAYRSIVHPLHAIYARGALPVIEQRIAAGLLRTTEAVHALNARLLDEAWIRRYDPTLASLTNVNTPSEMREAMKTFRSNSGSMGATK